MNNHPNRVFVITGPTASGKTQYAVGLAKKVNGVIINADAMQVYKEVPILTDQPTPQQSKEVRHTLYGFLGLQEVFSVYLWAKMLQKEVLSIQQGGATPIIVGGTCMYIYRLFTGVDILPDISLSERAASEEEYHKIGYHAFLQQVQKVDPNTPRDTQRLIRNHSFIAKTGRSLYAGFSDAPGSAMSQASHSSLEGQPAGQVPSEGGIQKYFPVDPSRLYVIALSPERSEVYEKCNQRFSNMVEEGVLDEVRACMGKYGSQFPAKKVNGYQELRDFILGEITLEKAKAMATSKTRLHAKQQYTWINGKLKGFISELITSIQR